MNSLPSPFENDELIEMGTKSDWNVGILYCSNV